MTDERYPYTHDGPAVHSSKLVDYLVSEQSLREDHPELFDETFVLKVQISTSDNGKAG